MNKYLLPVALAAILASCSTPKPDPVADALTAELSRTVEGVKKVNFEAIELLDSVSLGQEFEYRESLFKFKEEVMLQKINGYYDARDYPHYWGAHKVLDQTRSILEGLPALKEQQRDSLGKIVYYDYKFSASIDTEKGTVLAKDWYVCLTPQMQVLKCTPSKKELKNGLGKVIPGYMELLDKLKAEEKE